MRKLIIVAAVLACAASLLCSQSAPKLTGVEPDTCKVGATVTATGENLGKGHVSAIFLTVGDSDFRASIVEQSAEKIILKIPQVKAGRYNLTIQVKNEIFIQPVHVTVED